MESLKQEAIRFIEHLQTLYFEQRNLSALLPAMTEDTSWIGTGVQEFCEDVGEARAALALEGQEYGGSFTIIMARWRACCLSETVCVVYGEIIARPDDTALADVYNRVTAVCTRTSNGMKLSHLHMSSPDADQEDGRFYVKREDAARRETLRLRTEKIAGELRARNSQLEALTENIPGGIHQCANDMDLTILDMSNGFLKMFGYTKQEIQEYFQNRFIYMIYEEDRDSFVKTVCRQLSQGPNVDLEYRVYCKNGELLWVLDRGQKVVGENNEETFFCMLLDITRQKEQMEELRLTVERHQIIMDQTTDIIFEWDIASDELTFSSNWRRKFGYEAIQDNISQKIPLSQNIHPADMPAFIKIMKDSAAGVPYSETEFRIQDVMGCFKWHRIRATIQYDSRHRPIKAIGVILDIDADKRQKEHLLEQAQRDPLTNLYNKTAVRELVTRQITENRSGSYQVLLMIDVDNFKGVNDTYGHLCGDTLLSDVAGVLRSQFRCGDIVGRIGGDEFLVYLPQIAEKKEAAEKIQGLLTALATLCPIKDGPTISCSIGAAFFSQKEADYFTLYKCADAALYQIKAQGKNNFAFYDPNNCEASCDLPDSVVGGIDSETETTSDAVGEKLAQYTFRMLYNSIDVTTAVEQLLEIVGRAYDVSRVYIFESSPDGRTCSNTFEWCNTGVPSEMAALQNIDYIDDVGDYQKNFDHNNLFYCHDIRKLHPDVYAVLAPQGIRSLLQCAIMDDGVFMGYVGFDECREKRAWTKAQIASLTLISNILSTFLLKFRLKEGNAKNGKQQEKHLRGAADFYCT